jgi:hypothetical protein
MQRWKEGLIAAAVVAVCLYGIVAQFSADTPPTVEARRITEIAVGDRLLADITLRDVGDPPLPRSVLGSYGRVATVLYSWSAACPCILDLEPRLRALGERFGKDQGVAWLALAGEPDEDLAQLREKRAAMQAFYPVLRDPEQQICRRLGLLHAGQVAVLDRDGQLVYRGAIDDHWRTGKAEHLEAALIAVTSGKRPAVSEVPRQYGCAFSVPLSCLSEETPEAE